MIELARRRMMMGGSAKPYDAEVEWVASDGNTVVDTLIAPNTLTNYHLVFSNWAMKRDVNFFAALDVKNNVYEWYRELSVGHTDLMRSEYSRESQLQWLPTSNIANVKFSITKVGFAIIYHNYSTGSDYANNVTPSSYQWTGTLKLFGTDVYPTMNMSARLHPSYLTDEDGNKIGDYIPVRKDGKGYLYDKISKQLLPNIGPGLSFGPDYNPFAYQYLTFVPLEDSTFSFSKRGTGNDIEYSIDGGAWTALASEANTPTVGAGHNIRWRAELVPSTVSGSQGIGTFSASGLYDAMGNTMSLLYGDNFVGQTTLVGTYTFYNLWRADIHIYRADRMVLPAMSLSSTCYYQMFYSCKGLTTAPELPATSLAQSCYYQMFQGCTGLTSAPTSLPATTLTNNCYRGMFRGCTSLTTAPALPATTLAQSCYYQMFYSCKGLTTAPELPATSLVTYCYYQMFYACSKLIYIKCLATNISASGCLSDWTNGVASTGTLVKNAAMTTLPTGASGIPSGWTVVDDPSTINS